MALLEVEGCPLSKTPTGPDKTDAGFFIEYREGTEKAHYASVDQASPESGRSKYSGNTPGVAWFSCLSPSFNSIAMSEDKYCRLLP